MTHKNGLWLECSKSINYIKIANIQISSLSSPDKLMMFFFTQIFIFFLGLDGSWGQPLGAKFPVSPWATMLALRLDCPTASLTTPQKVLSIWRLAELKLLDFSDRARIGISSLTSRHKETFVVR